MMHICSVCGYQYNDDVEMKPFDALPDDWVCPVCGAPKSAFNAVNIEYESDG